MSLNLLLLALVVLTVVSAEVPFEDRHVPELVNNVNDQFHNQDSLGQYKYAYINGESSKEESRSLDGVTRGSYSYMDADGNLQKVVYQADAEHGFRVSGTNIPSAPLTPDSKDEITPAFSTKLIATARKISREDDEEQTTNIQNNPNNIINNNNNKPDEKKINNDDKQSTIKYNEKNVQSTQQPDKKVGGYQYLFPLAQPSHEFSPLNTEYLMPLSTAFDYFSQPNQISSAQGYDYRDPISFLPFYQPEFIPPFARSHYRSPYAFFNGFIPLFRTQRSGIIPNYSEFKRNYLNQQRLIDRDARWNRQEVSDRNPWYQEHEA